MARPNVLLVVWDAARADHLDAAPTLSSLAAENVRYDNAVASSTWSLPTHVSLFTGVPVTDHGVFSRTRHTVGDLYLVEKLGEQGYRTYGVSANPFASPLYDFDGSFDAFDYVNGTDIADPTGLDAREVVENHGRRGWAKAARQALEHENTRGSLANLLRAGVGATVDRVPRLRQLPHPWFTEAGTFGYSYRPAHNTDRIASILAAESGRERPFFLFTNYMSPHAPYRAPPEYRDTEAASAMTPADLYEFNETYSHPWQFLERQLAGEAVETSVLEPMRDLYAGDIRELDDHLERLLGLLERYGLAEDTVVIVTADHGELLGERDDAGRFRVGHEGTIADAVAEVPLVVAHPALPARRVTEQVPLRNLCPAVLSLAESVESDSLPAGEDVVLCESPAHEDTEVFEAFDVPDEVLAEAVTTHTVVGYADDWTVVVDSTGERYAERDGRSRAVSAAPDDLVDRCEQAVSRLTERDDIDRAAGDSVPRSQLEALGYR
jgi:arylsulfatase A-like enzyme